MFSSKFDMVLRMNLTDIEKEYIKYKVYFGAELKTFSFPYGMNEVREKLTI